MIKNNYNQYAHIPHSGQGLYTKPVEGKRANTREYEALKPILRSEYEYQKHHYKHKMNIQWDWTFDQYCASWWGLGPMIYNFKGRKKAEYSIYPRDFSKPFGKDNYIINTNEARKTAMSGRRKKQYKTNTKGIISPDGTFSKLKEFEAYYKLDRYKSYKILRDDSITEFRYSDKPEATSVTGNVVDVYEYMSIQSSGPRDIAYCEYCGKKSKREIKACQAWTTCKYTV